MSKTLIIVSDSSHARIFSANSPSSSLEEVEDFVHPEARQHAKDITADLPGKQRDANLSGRHDVNSMSDPHTREVLYFARKVAQYLQEKLTGKEFARLIIVSEPSFLGVLRKELGAEVKKSVIVELNKNLVKHSLEDIRAHLAKVLSA